MSSINPVSEMNKLLELLVAQQVHTAEKFVKVAAASQVNATQGLGLDTFVPSGDSERLTTYEPNRAVSQ